MSIRSVVVTSEDTFTDWLAVNNGSVSVTGTFDAVVTLQHKQAISDVETDQDTAEAGVSTFDGGGDLYRVGVKAGDFTSGEVTLVIRSGCSC